MMITLLLILLRWTGLQKTVLISKILLNWNSISMRPRVHQVHFIGGHLGMCALPIRIGVLIPIFMGFSSMIWPSILSKLAIWICAKITHVGMGKNVFQRGTKLMLGTLVTEVTKVFLIDYINQIIESYIINCHHINSWYKVLFVTILRKTGNWLIMMFWCKNFETQRIFDPIIQWKCLKCLKYVSERTNQFLTQIWTIKLCRIT